MRKFALFTIPLLLTIALAITACGETGGSNGGNGGSYSTPDVTMSQHDFDHGSLTIPAGTTVRFINPPSAAMHLLCVGENANCATNAPGPSALTGGNSIQVTPGETKEVTFDKAGTYKITCTLHPMMNLTITVH
jgi:plastocyanin